MRALSPPAELDRIIRKPELLQITGVSIATIYRWIADGHFPAPVKLGPNASGWRESAIREWLETREPIASGDAESSTQQPRSVAEGDGPAREAD